MSEMDEPVGATPLDDDEIEGLRQKHVSTRAELNQLEQAAIVKGLAWLDRQKTPEVLSLDFLRELHRRLFSDVWAWAGTFRVTEKNIGVDPATIQVETQKLLDDANYWIKENVYPARELAVRFHHRLVKIHPFPNGNGRHARIMADAILQKHLGEQAINWAGKYELGEMNDRRKQYISALKAADGEDYQPLLEFVDARVN